ncbi:penicillin-binding transpeptidase domain-containing protein [Actinokineospora auranticolor]|uniref:penicillin-binding transpeptidase domain-containing protein n=1 Tax=Actinokineospora auranticolor TaxID=155976 RepID=UPI001FE86352|nr:penicillin-binding transpeptidase domain-containing protein [Actinokineospora auranticolor]
MSTTRKRWVLVLSGVVAVALIATAVFFLVPGKAEPPKETAAPEVPAFTTTTEAPPVLPVSAPEVARDFATAISADNLVSAGMYTDDRAAATKGLQALVGTVDAKSVQVEVVTQPAEVGDRATAGLRFTWSLRSQSWAYSSELPMVKAPNGAWVVHWMPTIVHPKLVDGNRFVVVLDSASAQGKVDRDGVEIPNSGDFAPLLTRALAATDSAGGGATNGGTAEPAVRVALLDAGGKEIENLFGVVKPAKGPVKTTLSVKAQYAAQEAVDSVSKPAYLVAIDSKTGGILAVAQNQAAGSAPKALNGLYAPGSTFKVATAAAVLGSGTADVNTVLPCPGSAVFGQRTIRNAGFDDGDVPLHKAFADSCNTTFAGLATKLPMDALPKAAEQLGLGADFEVPGLTTQAGKVVAADSTAAQVENSIGQGTVQASPFGLALMSATVAHGGAVTPQLFVDTKTVVRKGYRGPSGAVVANLQSMMREVVTAGSGKALRGYGAVAGKTGTAQFGGGAQAHGWFAGYRGNVAFAILVEDAGTSAPAVSVTGAFLGGLG